MQKIICFLLFSILLSLTACSQTSNIEKKTISVNLLKGQSAFFSYRDKDYNLKELEFSYITGRGVDSTIIKEINDEILYLEYFAVFNDNGKYLEYKEGFFSGLESLNFKINQRLELFIANKEPVLISKYLNIQRSNPLLKDNIQLIKYFEETKSIYENNLRITDSLFKIKLLNETKYKYWLDMNKLIYDQKLLSPLSRNHQFFSKIKEYIPENNIEKDLINFKYLTSSVYWSVLYSLANYKALSKNLDFNNPKVFVESIYSCNNPRAALKIIEARLKNYPTKDQSDFKEALIISKKFSGDSLYKQWENFSENVTRKEITNLDLIKLESKSLNQVSLKQILDKNKGYITFVDLWAHWCIPCRKQLPLIQTFKEENKNLEIKFLTISLDEEKHKYLWIKAITDEKLDKDPQQFRLINPKLSIFTKQLQIETIPRYLILGRNGEIISDNFYLPSDKEFKSELLKIVNEN